MVKMSNFLKCPVCTLYLRPSITLKQHLASHSKRQLIRIIAHSMRTDNVENENVECNNRSLQYDEPNTINLCDEESNESADEVEKLRILPKLRFKLIKNREDVVESDGEEVPEQLPHGNVEIVETIEYVDLDNPMDQIKPESVVLEDVNANIQVNEERPAELKPIQMKFCVHQPPKDRESYKNCQKRKFPAVNESKRDKKLRMTSKRDETLTENIEDGEYNVQSEDLYNPSSITVKSDQFINQERLSNVSSGSSLHIEATTSRLVENEGLNLCNVKLCIYCGIKIPKSMQLHYAHEHNFSWDTHYKCMTCQLKFNVPSDALAHLNIHPLKCPICKRTYRTFSFLLKHLNAHNGL